MKIIENNIIPFKGFKAINLFGVVFKRQDTKLMTSEEINHEAIHTAQMKELGYIPFYILYFFEWLFLLVTVGNRAYWEISFEKEAYKHMNNLKYLEYRHHYAQWRYNLG